MVPSTKRKSLKRTTRASSKLTRKTKRANLKPIAGEEETVTMTRSELETLIADQVAEILAEEANKNTGRKVKYATMSKSTGRKLI